MATAAQQFNDESLLRSLTRTQLEEYDDETIHRLARYVRNKRQDEIEKLCAQETASFDSGVLYWLTTQTATLNPQHASQGLPLKAPFPRYPYFVPLFSAFLAEYPQLFIPKSRTMMTSWAAMGFAAHRAQWFQEETIVQTKNEDTCAHLIDYVRQLWNHQADFLKQRHPLLREATYALAWKGGGEVASIPSGADKARSFHASWYIQDESAFLPEGQECLGAVIPSGARIICISSAGPGWFGDACRR